MELNHPTKVGLHNPPSSSQSKATRELNSSKGNDHREVTLEPYFSKKCQVCFVSDKIELSLAFIMTMLRLG